MGLFIPIVSNVFCHVAEVAFASSLSVEKRFVYELHNQVCNVSAQYCSSICEISLPSNSNKILKLMSVVIEKDDFHCILTSWKI